MSFWESFREGYRSRRSEVPPPYVSPREEEVPPEPALDEAEELRAIIRERDAEIAEQRELIEALAVERRQREEELKIARRSGPKGGSDEKYKKLRRYVTKLIHPDRASGDPNLAKLLEAMCKDLNVEIERIERA